jgi:S-layer protein (TIGR01564 family)
MRLKRVIKKIAALSVGATMVGATVLGAMAADLGDYPSPLFIKDGKFSGILVVGDKADAKDIIGITDLMGSLQYRKA